ncbi:hypothetical protein [Corynebacterium massiliense]|uniref:Uncharacterized protein n=1 Tax=Corynebacterium massiliense DSM 45435 TaxID=1121364 RepID=A0ABY7U8L7_9CORY|nr:hypothetical protein [Corynebacterium massiliense]WCZ32949.1 hypothetical protein CMASS_07595 [Corynebacterium massiliense DSM 45435]
MHYTSWDRTDRENPRLLAEAGPDQLATFGQDTAAVGDATWSLETADTTATASGSDGSVYRLDGHRRKDDRLVADLAGRRVEFHNEKRNDWVIVDDHDEKIGQFSGANSGVRRAIVEFDGPAKLSGPETVAVSWFARLILEARLEKKTTGLIATLVVSTLVALVAFFS